MPFVVTLGLVALCTVLALVRVQRLGKVAYPFAVVVSEIPHVAGLYLVLATWLAWVEGQLEGVSGLVLMVLVAATLTGQAELARRGTGARAAVHQGLGSAGIQLPDASLGHRLRPWWAPFPLGP